MRIEEDVKLDFKDVLIRPKRSTLASRKEVDVSREYNLKRSGRTFSGVPIIAANMDGVGTFDMARAFMKDGNGLTVALHKHYPLEDLVSFFGEHGGDSVWYSIGLAQADQGEMVEELILSGVDIVKVGIGPGSVCTTRKMTGVGYPQLSAIIECADAAHGLGGYICGDGGCTVPGDIAKAFGGGSDFVMLGGMFSGHDQAEQSLVEIDGEKFLQFYGMSSDTAMTKHKGGVAEYRASEGKTVKVPYRGDVSGTLQDILGGLRSACTYVGAKRLKELSKRTTFIRVTQQLNNVFGQS